MELADLIDRLEKALSSGTTVPATGRVLVEKEKLAELVARIRSAIPVDIQEAQDLLQMRESLINQALTEARRIRSAAEEEARSLVKENEIAKEARKHSDELTTEAQRRAQRILDEAESQASSRRAGADEYAQIALQKLEEELTGLLETVRHGIEVLEVEREPSA
ncbi:MAG: hypothetical protein HYX93_07025 [Chloroflexi bacterium]|nr:hypothetical protein [Chloroflexota bacterium]